MITIGDMSFERARLPLGVFETNTGQVDGLPANPRKWSKKEVERLAEAGRIKTHIGGNKLWVKEI